MKLFKLSNSLYIPFKTMVEDYLQNEEWNYYYKYEEGINNIEKYIKRLDEIEKNIDLNYNSPPFSQYFLFNNELSEVRGIIRIQHNIDPIHGNISYDVPPSMRLKGYGKTLLKLAIHIAFSKLNIKNIFISCHQDNEASRRIILSNNGVFIDTIFDSDEEVYIERYQILNKLD